LAGYNGSSHHAIHGSNLGYPNAYAGYFDGKVRVTGLLTKSGGGFLIDHPADPENMIWRHSFVESPEMLPIYKGREIVLTCVNGYTPLYLDGAIAEGRFTVRTVDGGVADHEFSWVIYGTRNDPWAQQHQYPVEEAKTQDREFKPGEYLNPEAFGVEVQPESGPKLPG
jgi:hypothetical protein